MPGSHAKSMETTPIGVKMPEKMQRRHVTPLWIAISLALNLYPVLLQTKATLDI